MSDYTDINNLDEKIKLVTNEQWQKCFNIISYIDLGITRLVVLPPNVKINVWEYPLKKFFEEDELNKMGIVADFDFRKWEEGKEILNTKKFDFNSLDLKTLCMLFTPILQINKTYPDFLETQFKNGNMSNILKAIQNKIELSM